jgi:hypothetical protein
MKFKEYEIMKKKTLFSKLTLSLSLLLLFTFSITYLIFETRTTPTIVTDKPVIAITKAEAYSATSNTTGMHEANVQVVFGTIAGTYTGCSMQAYTTVDGLNYLTFGSAQSLTVTTGAINTWTLVETAPSTAVSSTAAAGFGVYTKYKFSCSSAYGTNAPATINVIYYPTGISAQSLDPSANPTFAGLTIPSLTSTLIKTNSNGTFGSSTSGVDYETPLTFSSPLTRATNNNVTVETAINWIVTN